MSTDFILTLDRLQAAVAGAAAIRLRQALEPAGGPGSKVFPPTHEGGQYAWETRRVDGQDVRCVLLDSVQSQANRCELALLDALRDGRLRLPLIEARFAEFSNLGAVSTLEAPHRIADAIFRDSTLDGVPFRDSVIGQAFIESTLRDANGLFRWCPTALVFGMWDSTGSVGGLGTKFARALSAEIIGYGVQAGVHTSSRIDPLGIKNIEIYVTPDEDWTTDAGAAKQGKSGPEKTKPSALNHSNIPPTLSVADDNYTSVKKGEP
ncbi:MAG: type I-U CRISPR-associated protein Cas7, partial [Proteobacteria bacterium]|nr:type I-U CRISPR-associated protein Cas7 [Pseudomonadota bacterium]